MKKEKKPRKSQTAYRYIATRVIVFGLAIWLLFAGVFTWILSEAFVYQVKIKASSYTSQVLLLMRNSPDALPDELVISLDRRMDELMSYCWNYDKILPIMLPHNKSDIFNPGPMVKLASGEYDKNDIFRRHLDFEDKITTCEEVAFVFQLDDAVVDSRSHMSYTYTSLENWQSGNPQPTGYGLTYLDIPYSKSDHFPFRSTKGYGQFRGNCLLRLTGYWEEKTFQPVSIDIGFRAYVYEHDLLNQFKGGKITDLCSLDAKNALSWKNVADYYVPADGRELQTIYAWDINTSNYMYESFSINADTYSDLVDYIYKNDKSRQGDILETIIEECFYGSGYNYTIVIRCWPLRYVLIHGCHIYLISLLLTGMIIILVLRRTRRKLTIPLEYMVINRKLHPFDDRPGVFGELHTINSRLQDANQKLTEANTEIQRLNKALDYAKNAEENRRQLVSNLTHELKTPLAVIHSYAEGLQEDISYDKRDRYLSVITEESERMDAMVLEMLDLSRLEAGKVRLSTEPFSLLAAVKAVTEKFSPMLEAKKLTLSYEQEENHIVNADEGRIIQAITNLVSNAFKYAPEGSQIRIRVGTYSESSSFYIRTAANSQNIGFSIENESEPLPQDKLERVWDSFYRADPSHSEPGTGLGLAIVKNIVELHGGKCYARNATHKSADGTATYVNFGFILPNF